MRPPATERGDTLIEVLIALVIISLSVVALLGAIATSATGSAEHKSVSALDTLLRNFAEAAKYDVQLAPTTSAQYANCATSYLVGTEFPQSGQAGQTTVSVFGSGFAAGDSVTVTIGGASLGSAQVKSGMSAIATGQSDDGFVVVNGTVPAGLAAGPQTVLLTDTSSGKSVTSPTPFNVSSSAASSGQLSKYSVGIGDPNPSDSTAQQAGIAYWNSSTQQFVPFTSVTGCSPAANTPYNSGIQMLTFTAKSDNGVLDKTSIVVTNPGDTPPLPAPDIAVSSNPTSPTVGNTVTFTATLTGSTGGSVPSCPSGTPNCVTWVFTGVSSSPTCQPTGLNQTSLTPSGNSATTSCKIVNVQAGLQVTAQYSGDTNYSSNSGYWSGQVAKASPSITISAPATDQRGTAISANSITASLSSAYSPTTGTITFTVFGPQNSAPTSCTSGGTAVGTASVTNNGNYHPSAGFTPTTAGAYWWYASYGGDSNNLGASSTCGSTMAMTFVGATVSQTGSNKGTSGSASVTLGSTPATGSQLVILVYAVPSGGTPGAPVITGTAVATPLSGPLPSVSPGNNNQGQPYELWAYVESATGAGKQVSVSVTHASTVELDVLAITGNASSSPAANTNTGNSSSPTATFTAAPQTGDLEIAFIGASSNDGGVGATPSNWTSVENANANGYGVASYYTNLGAATSTTFALSNSVHWATIALDVASS